MRVHDGFLSRKVVCVSFALTIQEFFSYFCAKYQTMDYEENNIQASMASEPSAAFYYGSSTRLRESGIIPELSQLDKTTLFGLSAFCKGILNL